MGKTYNEHGEDLNFTLTVTKLGFSDSINGLNFKVGCSGLIFAESAYPKLNFRISDYDGVYILYKVLIDFIENYSVGDIFSAIQVTDDIVDFMGNV